MTKRLKVCVISGGRADYGLLVPPLRALTQETGFLTQLVLTGQHLMSESGDTTAQVREDGFEIAAEVDMELRGDDAVSITEGAGRGLAAMAKVLAELAPDIVLLLGDRYEILCSAIAATIARIPIAHIAGGDVTEGAFDDAFRHAITKMAHLHFVTNTEAARRVEQLGEAKDRVHIVGSPGLDLIRTTALPSYEEFFAAVGLEPRRHNVLVTFHPVTLAGDSTRQLNELLAALAMLGDDISVLFTGSNADPEARALEQRVKDFAASHSTAQFVPSLGASRFFSALSYMDVMLGNSSSGLYEAPSFGIPSVNVGDRQKGRLLADTVICCDAERGAILKALKQAFYAGRRPTINPYGDGHAAERIVAVLKSVTDPRALLHKSFVDQRAA